MRVHSTCDSIRWQSLPSARPIVDRPTAEKVGEIVARVTAGFPDPPAPRQPGHAQLRAIDKRCREAP
jgi:hypothetical protein